MRQSVLNREQQKVLELLKEIDIICRKKQDHIFSFSVSYSLRSDGTAFSTESRSWCYIYENRRHGKVQECF